MATIPFPFAGLRRTAAWKRLRSVKRFLVPPAPVERVEPDHFRGELAILQPPAALEARQIHPFPVRIRNTGPAAFPNGGVSVVAQWHTRHGESFGKPTTLPLSSTIYSSEETSTTLPIPAPDFVGDFELSLQLAAGGRRFGNSSSATIPVVGRRETDIDYHAVYRTANLTDNHWWVVGAYHSREAYEKSKRERREMLTRYGLTPDSRVLDVGCGTGQMADALLDYLSPQGRYAGTDIGAEAIAFCNRQFARPNFAFRQGGMTTIPFGPHHGPFDLAIYFSVFTHTFVDESALLLAETRKLLAPTGCVVADVITSELCERGAGHRGEMVVNREYFLRLAGAVGFVAEEIGRWDWNLHAVRIMYALRPT
jgi:SAM-dependent methyltransferase